MRIKAVYVLGKKMAPYVTSFFGVAILMMMQNAVGSCSTVNISDTATITGSCQDYILPSAGNVNYITDQNATITSGSYTSNSSAITVNGAIGSFTNNGILGSSIDQGFIFNVLGSSSVDGNFINNGTITNNVSKTAVLFDDNSIFSGTFINSSTGVIEAKSYSAVLFGITTVSALTNDGQIKAAGGDAIDLYKTTLGKLTNNNLLQSTSLFGTALYMYGTGGAAITTLENNGSMYSLQAQAIYLESGSSITTLTNSGSIYSDGSAAGIENYGTITTLNNAQGAGNSNGVLKYTGTLPANYNIIINSPSTFGKLAVTSGIGNTVFGISSLSAIGSAVIGNYSSVITGVTNTQLGITGTSLMGATSNGYTYNLVEAGLGTNVWNLAILSAPEPMPTGPSLENTQASVANTAQVLQSTYALQNSVLANSFTYDCAVFDKNNVCVSAGGRNTAVSASNGLNNTSALLIAAYRLSPKYRIGAYADQNLSVNNAGSTLNLGNNTPLIGLFGVWNENLDGTGTEVKVSAAYGQKSTTVTRTVVGTGSTASEAGSGGSTLNSQGAQVVAKYGFGLAGNNVIVSPYVGVRYTQNNMGGYTEAASSTVTAPLTYSALNTNATTALAGVGAQYKFMPQATAFASAGVESDTNTNSGSYSATGVSGLTAVNFNSNPVKTRPTAMLGAYYDLEKNQRLGVTGIYRQEPYQGVSTATVMATYTVGL